jgi:hypothetical protein
MIVGIDYSMTSPAMCFLGTDKTFSNSKHFFLTSKKRDLSVPLQNIFCDEHRLYTSEIERFSQTADFFINLLVSQSNTPIVYLEDYSLGSKGRVFAIAENTAILKYKLFERGIRVHTVPPTVLKKFAFGKGNAKKEQMYEAYQKLGNNPDLVSFYHARKVTKIGSPISDIVDAFFLARYGAQDQKL